MGASGRMQQFQIQILTTGTAYLEDRGVSVQRHQDGADDAEFWGNAGISPPSDSGNQRILDFRLKEGLICSPPPLVLPLPNPKSKI
jgi:hypothetical protein